MDTSEELVKAYLRHLGFSHIEYEPDGNVPPDFLAEKRVAVEVRRLNQNEITGSGFRALEEPTIPLSMKATPYPHSSGRLLASSQLQIVTTSDRRVEMEYRLAIGTKPPRDNSGRWREKARWGRMP